MSPTLSSAKPVVPLAAVCACVCAHVYARDCFHLFIRCTRYLLSVYYVPGTVAKFLWVCLLMPLLLLEGSFCALLLPKLLPLCQSGCLRFCASLCAFLSLSLCRALFVCLSLPWCLTLPPCLLVTPKAPELPFGPTSRPDLPCPLLHPDCWSVPMETFLAPSSMGMFSASKGLCPGAPDPGPNLSTRSGGRRIDGAPTFLSVTEALEQGSYGSWSPFLPLEQGVGGLLSLGRGW